MADKGRAVVKKVSPYPIPVQMQSELGVITGRIMKLTTHGFLAEVTDGRLQPGMRMNLQFELPVLHLVVSEKGRMAKLYNQLNGSVGAGRPPVAAPAGQEAAPSPEAGTPKPSGPHVIHIVEVHFDSLSAAGKQSISTFLRALTKHSA